MNYEIWHRIYIISGAAAVFFSLLTIFFIVRFRFFELLSFRIRSKSVQNTGNHDIPDITDKADEASPVTERLSGNKNYSGITPDGTVIAKKNKSDSDSFEITRNIIVISSDPSVID